MNKETSNSQDGFDLGQYFSLIWHWIWLIGLVTILVAIGAYFISKRMTPIYQAKTTVMVNATTSNPYADYSTLLLNSQLTQTYSQMIVEETVLQDASQRLNGVNINPVNVSAQQIPNTQLISVTFESPDPKAAALIANTIVSSFSDQIHGIQEARYASSKQSLQQRISDIEAQIYTMNDQLIKSTDPATKSFLLTKIANSQATYTSLLQSYEQIQIAEAETSSSIVQVEPAIVPDKPIKPKTIMNVALAGAACIIISGVALYFVSVLDDTLKTPQQFSEKLGLPILSIIPLHKVKDSAPVTATQPHSHVSESFRTLRTNLLFAGIGADQQLKNILITSTNTNEGKSTILVNLGVVLAQNGSQVNLLDADLRRPSIHTILHLPNSRGLSEAFLLPTSQDVGNSIIQITRVKNLYAVTSGKLPPNPLELLGSPKMSSIMKDLQDKSEIILIDTPPALTVSDATVLLPMVQGVLLVLRPGVTHLAAARQLIDLLQRNGAKIIGLVINGVKLSSTRSKYYYQGKKDDFELSKKMEFAARAEFFSTDDPTKNVKEKTPQADSDSSEYAQTENHKKRFGKRKAKDYQQNLTL